MVTAAFTVCLGSNWPAEPFTLWVEIHFLNCDQFLAEFRVPTAYPNLPQFFQSQCACRSTSTTALSCASLIKAYWLVNLSLLSQCAGLVPQCKISLMHALLSPGEISTRTILDREQQSSYQLVVVVQDGGSPARSATGTAFITVLDDNDNDPAFTHCLSGKNIIIQVLTWDYRHRQKIKYLSYLY